MGNWTSSEKKEARRIYEIAVERAHQEAMDQHHARKIEIVDDLWVYEKELGRKRREMDELLDYRYSVLLCTFAHCVRRGWLREEELQGLSEDRKEKILQMSQFY